MAAGFPVGTRPLLLLATLGLAASTSAPYCSPVANASSTCTSILDIALIVDNSASVVNVTGEITNLLSTFVSGFATSSVQFSLISFGTNAELLTNFTSNASAVLVPRGDQGGFTGTIPPGAPGAVGGEIGAGAHSCGMGWASWNCAVRRATCARSFCFCAANHETETVLREEDTWWYSVQEESWSHVHQQAPSHAL